jgi:hypothetical protein
MKKPILLLRGFFLFWYTFLIGDDWMGAIMILGGFAGTFELLRLRTPAFWLLPFAVLLSLSVSLLRE